MSAQILALPAAGSQSVKLVAARRQERSQRRPGAAHDQAGLAGQITDLPTKVAQRLQGAQLACQPRRANRIGTHVADNLPSGAAEPQLVVRSLFPTDLTINPSLAAERVDVIFTQPQPRKLRIPAALGRRQECTRRRPMRLAGIFHTCVNWRRLAEIGLEALGSLHR